MKPRLSFWFEFASTYSYLAAARIDAVAQARGVELVYRPFLLGPIFREQGLTDSPFNVYSVKGRYMWRDLERLTAELGLPFRRPSVFPRNGLLAARAALVIGDLGKSSEFVPRVYEANFARDEDIAAPAVLGRIIASLGLEPDAVLAAAESAPVKARLRASTEEARSAGIFGAPSFTVGDELFWGNDRLEAAFDWAERAAAAPAGSCAFADSF